jgi:hypothetical protein
MLRKPYIAALALAVLLAGALCSTPASAQGCGLE